MLLFDCSGFYRFSFLFSNTAKNVVPCCFFYHTSNRHCCRTIRWYFRMWRKCEGISRNSQVIDICYISLLVLLENSPLSLVFLFLWSLLMELFRNKRSVVLRDSSLFLSMILYSIFAWIETVGWIWADSIKEGGLECVPFFISCIFFF